MTESAREKQLFLMEGVWTHFFPAIVEARKQIAAGRIGDVRMVLADFGFCAPWDPDSRVLDPALAGGALLDVGIYPVTMARMVFREDPQRIAALAHIGETGVDEQGGIVLGYSGGRMAVLSCAIRTATQTEAWIYGTQGYIRVPRKFFKPERLVIGCDDSVEEEIRTSLLGYGFTYEAREVMRCLREGLVESPVVPHAESLAVLETLDRIRDAWGLRYPFEADAAISSASTRT
jgi:predicted dehydrogenase